MRENIVKELRENADSFNGDSNLGKAWPDLYREAADQLEQLQAAKVTDMDKQKAGDTTDPMASIHWLLNSALNIAHNCDMPEELKDVLGNALGDIQPFHK